ncbi:hypothetical protein SFC42_24120 [Priestia filamentosa]|uniref:hypothetical protein n=1 Tax=Priestia filamentosa TaxID=1402861 RepID=UPI003982E862
MNLLSNKKFLYLFSFIVTIIFSIIPGIGMRIDGTYRFFGFPAQWLGYYGGKQFSFEVFGLLLNFLVFYFFFFLLNKILKNILRT